MKICIPSADDKGLESKVFDHFGRAPFFTLVELENGEIEVMPNPDCHSTDDRGRHSCHHTGHLKARGVNAVVSGGIGRNAYAGLNRAGFEVLVADQPTVRDLVETVKNGGAQRLEMDRACGGGRFGDGHGHGRGHGYGNRCGDGHPHHEHGFEQGPGSGRGRGFGRNHRHGHGRP